MRSDGMSVRFRWVGWFVVRPRPIVCCIHHHPGDPTWSCRALSPRVVVAVGMDAARSTSGHSMEGMGDGCHSFCVCVVLFVLAVSWLCRMRLVVVALMVVCVDGERPSSSRAPFESPSPLLPLSVFDGVWYWRCVIDAFDCRLDAASRQ